MYYFIGYFVIGFIVSSIEARYFSKYAGMTSSYFAVSTIFWPVNIMLHILDMWIKFIKKEK